ncbi:MAG: hypothetical protein ACXAEN_20415 [Candidatus Thorarchaeota archaeon]
MSRTIKGGKGPGYDYWKSRHPTLTHPCRYTKTQTHRHERRVAKQRIREDIVGADASDDLLVASSVCATDVEI